MQINLMFAMSVIKGIYIYIYKTVLKKAYGKPQNKKTGV